MADVPTQPRENGGIYNYRMNVTDQSIKDLEDEVKELRKIVTDQAITIASLKERLSIFALAQSALTIIVGAVAAFVGRL